MSTELPKKIQTRPMYLTLRKSCALLCRVACAPNALDAVLQALKKHHAVILNTYYRRAPERVHLGEDLALRD